MKGGLVVGNALAVAHQVLDLRHSQDTFQDKVQSRRLSSAPPAIRTGAQTQSHRRNGSTALVTCLSA